MTRSIANVLKTLVSRTQPEYSVDGNIYLNGLSITSLSSSDLFQNSILSRSLLKVGLYCRDDSVFPLRFIQFKTKHQTFLFGDQIKTNGKQNLNKSRRICFWKSSIYLHGESHLNETSATVTHRKPVIRNRARPMRGERVGRPITEILCSIATTVIESKHNWRCTELFKWFALEVYRYWFGAMSFLTYVPAVD